MDFLNKKCTPGIGAIQVNNNEIQQYLLDLPGWELKSDERHIVRRFEFNNFKQTMFFMNAVAYLCECESHHPDVHLGYNHCELEFSTHDIKSLSENDFICAAKINRLLV